MCAGEGTLSIVLRHQMLQIASEGEDFFLPTDLWPSVCRTISPASIWTEICEGNPEVTEALRPLFALCCIAHRTAL